MTTNTAVADIAAKVYGSPDDPDTAANLRLQRVIARLLAKGQPITTAQASEAAGVSQDYLAAATAGNSLEYDDQGRIVGWDVTLNPTRHRFTINGRTLYAWCAPATMIFPPVIGHPAQIESTCPTTGTPIQMTVHPDDGITDLKPATAVVSIADPDRVDADRIRASLCNPMVYFATAEAAQDWVAHNPGMTVTPVADAYQQLMLPFIKMLRQ